ncbi:unnamed protein product [Owenia fusiformis]|uniref:Peptidase S54 rhomboid domain-containing protein n=1 Tax=Owenia fusiformis TaxID=6347 RepID=A0A8J1XK64_OWEFU|nr:unnamed protein product [Owenia fusiformis]
MTSFEMDHLDDDQKQRLLLESRYKPIFDRHEHEGGVPLKSLRQEMEEVGGSKLPRGKMELLLRRADEYQDGKLEFGEFIRIMTAETGDRQLTAFQKLLKISLNGVIPRNAQKKRMEYYLDHYNCCPPPLFMIFISLAEIGVFVFYAIELKGMGVETTASSGFPWYSPLIYKPQRRYEAWRFLTYMFIHVGYLHLVFNLIMQLMLGLPLEMVHKWWRVGFVYSLGVVAELEGDDTRMPRWSGGIYQQCSSKIDTHPGPRWG